MWAKKDVPRARHMVESIIVSPRARQILYEKLVPRYAYRPGHYTRVVDSWVIRASDASRMGYIELVDRAGEIRPAAPVGYEKRAYLWNVYQSGTRRDQRKAWKQAVLEGVIDPNGKVAPSLSSLRQETKYLWDVSSIPFRQAPIPTPSVQLGSVATTTTTSLVPVFTPPPDLVVTQGSSKRETNVTRYVTQTPNVKTPQALARYPGRKMIRIGSRYYEPFRTTFRRPKREFIVPQRKSR